MDDKIITIRVRATLYESVSASVNHVVGARTSIPVLFAAVVASMKTQTRLPHHGGMNKVPTEFRSNTVIVLVFQSYTTNASRINRGHHLLHDFESHTCGAQHCTRHSSCTYFIIRAENSSAAAVMLLLWHPWVIRNWSSTTAVTTRVIAIGRPVATRAADHGRMGEIMTSRDHQYYDYYWPDRPTNHHPMAVVLTAIVVMAVDTGTNEEPSPSSLR